MIITLVIDQYGDENNGTTISTRQFAKTLAERGHEVRVVGVTRNNPAGKEILYNVNERYVPLATYFAHKQGLLFGRATKKTIREAITGADIVHVIMPFRLEKKAMMMAQKMGIPVTGAFHVQAENVTTQLGLVKYPWANRMVYRIFRTTFYKHLDYIHCPSNMIANELKTNNYKANTCVISNGCVDNKLHGVVEPDQKKKHFDILSIGRLSKEKRQDVLIDAIAKSKYRDNIQLIIAGKGPIKDEIVAMGNKLPIKPLINFFSQEDLMKVIATSDLYVHPSDIEIEAISCVEAFRCGLVPIISNNPKCATQQFALDEKCIFEHGDSDDLAKKIDYFIEHEEEKRELSKKYIEYGKQFTVENSVEQLENMFITAIRENTK